MVRRLKDLPERVANSLTAERELRKIVSSYTGGRLTFTTEKSDYWWWTMVSGDSNSFRLIEAALDEPGWRDDLPKLLRGASDRQVRGRTWFTTTANAWAVAPSTVTPSVMSARGSVTGTTHAQVGKAATEYRWQGAQGAEGTPKKLALPWPAGAIRKLGMSHVGSGQPWASLQTLAAIPINAPRAFGYRVSRTVTPVQEKEKGKISSPVDLSGASH